MGDGERVWYAAQMRLPLSKIYRAFPELDRFDDALCKVFVKRAREAKKVSGRVFAVLVLPVYFLLAYFLFFILVWIDGWVALPDTPLFIALVMASIPLMPAVILLIFRDVWLRWALRSQVGSTNCLCGYSLLGLTLVDNAVQCPECGERISLTNRGLSPEDLLAGALTSEAG